VTTYRGALLRQVMKRPGFRANDYGIWMYKEDGVAIHSNTLLSALKSLEGQGIVRSEIEPGPRTSKTPRNWYPLV